MKGVRSLAVLVAVAVACSLLAVALASGAAAQDGATEIDSCTEITEPGEYELTADIQTDEEDSCLVVNSSDVALHGNGHVVSGPGPDEPASPDYAGILVDGAYQDYYRNVTVRDVEVADFDKGIKTGSGGFGDNTNATVEDTVVRDNIQGIYHEGGTLTLRNVVAEGSARDGLYALEAGHVRGTNLTVRANAQGVGGNEVGGGIRLKSSTVTNNDNSGVFGGSNVGLTLIYTEVSNNGNFGVVTYTGGRSITVKGGSVTDNGDVGIRAGGYGGGHSELSDVTVARNGEEGILLRDGTLTNVTATDNEGLELRGRNVTAQAFRVGWYATTAFENEDVNLEPVDQEALPPREGGTVAGDGLNVSGDVDGPVKLELDFDNDGTNDDTADLWRHDGDEWETVEEDPVIDGTVEATVERTGTYAPGIDDDGDGDPSTIDSCTVIDEPGEYELVDDIRTDEEDSCIVVNSSDVALHGSGHTVEGPGPPEDSDLHRMAAIYVKGSLQAPSENVTVRNVELVGWQEGLQSGSGGYGADTSTTAEDLLIRETHNGIEIEGEMSLTNVTVEQSEGGISAGPTSSLEATDVTVRENQRGVSAAEAGELHFRTSSITNNDDDGISIGPSASLRLTDTSVSGNGDHGVEVMTHSNSLTIEGGEVTDNGGDGVHAWGDDDGTDVRLDGVTVANNDGLEVNGAREDREDSNITASNLRVGQSATTAFEAEPIRLEPVDREALPEREGGTAAGDGLEVGSSIKGPVDLELAVETDDDTVDLWRHDGDEWETVEEDLPVSDGTIEATVERNGTYAPGTDDEEDSDGSEDESDDTDGSDGSEDSGGGSDGTGDSDGAKDGDRDGADGDASGDGSTGDGNSDEDGQTDQATATPASGASGSSDSGGSAGSGGGASGGTTATTAATATPGPTDAEPSDPGADDDADEAAKGGTETSGSDEGDTGTDATGDAGGDDSVETEDDDISISLADGPGFGSLAALLALAASGLFVRRRG